MKGIPVLNKKRVATIATLGIALIGCSVAIQPAQAFDPVANKFAIVGSDTLEDVVGALTNGTKISNGTTLVRTVNTDSSTNGSFDATGNQAIITKSGYPMVQRPNGSGDGITALLASIGYASDGVAANSTYTASSSSYTSGSIGYSVKDNSYQGAVDLVRSSSGGTTGSGGYLVRYPFGRDAIAYAYGSGVSANIPAVDLALIYQCTAEKMTQYGVTTVYTPQTGSGTGKDFSIMLNAVGNGNTNKDLLAYGSCVVTSQEHDASALGAGGIMPMSATRWIAMKNGASVSKINTGVNLGSPVTGKNAVDTVDGVAVPNLDYYKSGFGRDTYIMVEKARVTLADPKYDAKLAALLSYSDTTSLVYQGSALLGDITTLPTPLASTSQAVKQKFGFLPASTQATSTVVKKS